MVGSPANQPKKLAPKRPRVSLNCGKPLSGKIVFLDIKNHAAEASLKQSLLLLGAKVQSFLGPEVSFVVSEQTDTAANSPGANSSGATPASAAAGTSSPSQTLGGAGSARHASRCDRMVTVARRNQRKQRPAQDYLALARGWNVPVHTLAKVAASVERLNQRLKQPQASRTRLKAPFIKFESVARDAKPSYGELGRWPAVTLSGPAGSSPFSSRSAAPPPPAHAGRAAAAPAAPVDGQPALQQLPASLQRHKPRMTRKAVAAGGHCELCAEPYDSLSAHLATDKHLREAGCPRNYAALDVLIASAPGLAALTDRAGKLGGARTRSMSGGKLYAPGENSSGGKGYTPEPVVRCNGTSQRRHINRRTQLALLSSEASSFMSRQADTEAEALETGGQRRARRRSESDPAHDALAQRATKRRSQAEAFICDNREYYKFETPGSRLRCHGDVKLEPDATPPSPPPAPVPAPAPDVKCPLYEPSLTRQVWFSFECCPVSEPWLAAFRRQDSGREMYAPLPRSEPPFLLPYELPPPPTGACAAGRARGRGGRRRGGAARPRKSPRKHASTLAILSALSPRQRRVGAAAVQQQPQQVVRGDTAADLHRLANSLDAALDVSGDDLDLDPVDLSPPMLGEPDLAELMTSAAASAAADDLSESTDWRRRKKKKRKNLTGWPSAKRARQPTNQEAGSSPGGRRLRSAVAPRRESPRKRPAVVV